MTAGESWGSTLGKRKHNKANSRGKDAWAYETSPVVSRVVEQSEACLEAYRVNPLLVEEHANIEIATAQGGYGRRQIYELVQNGADALIDGKTGRIDVLLTDEALYCANEGAPVDVRGVECILSSHVSQKRGTEIGRFGLGFKSVLGVTTRPEFYSRSGSFRFDDVESRTRIAAIVPDAARCPVLRIGIPLDPREAARRDAVLAELMNWATTIVKLPPTGKGALTLPEDIASFPAEFLLFSPHVRELALKDVRRRVSRHISVRHSGKKLVLTEGQSSNQWAVFSRIHSPSPEAREDAGELARRDEIPIIWAVPLRGKQHKVGTFWAFFPTVDKTTLSGIINAPWKTNEDRQNLLPGAFNEELLDVLADVVVDSIRDLACEDDPASFLDVLPARGRETRSWADEYLTEKVYELAKDEPSLPDQLGRLRCPAELRVHPEGTPEKALAEWAAHENRPVDWCHHSVETRERRPRVVRLMGDRSASYSEWLESLAGSDGSIEASLAAVRTAAALLPEVRSFEQAAIRRSKILLTSDGQLVAPDAERVFLANLEYRSAADVAIVHPALQGHPDAAEALEAFGLHRLDAGGELLEMLTRAKAGSEIDWSSFWTLSRALGPQEAIEIIKANCKEPRATIRARTRSGVFAPLQAVLWPGPIVPSGDARDEAVTVDAEFHAPDQETLFGVGAVSSPEPSAGSKSEPWFRDYLQRCRVQYLQKLKETKTRSTPQEDYIVFIRERAFPGPLTPVQTLSPVAAERFCAALVHSGPGTESWEMGHETRRDVYPQFDMPSPAVWMMLLHGRLMTSLGITLQPAECVGPALAAHSELLPVASVPENLGRQLGLPSALPDVRPEMWNALLARISESEDDVIVGHAYALACGYTQRPPELRCRVGLRHEARPPEQVVVLSDRAQFEALVPQAVPTILVDSEADIAQLVELWNLRRPAEVVQTQVDCVLTSSPSPIVDDYPSLASALDNLDFKIARCTELRVETLTAGGKTSKPVKAYRQGDTLYVLDSLDEIEVLLRVAQENDLAVDLEWAHAVSEDKKNSDWAKKASEIRVQPTLQARVLKTLGVENLMRHLPAGLAEAAATERGDLAPEDVCDLALAVYSIGLLRQYRVELEECGLKPPTVWAGSRAARHFVRELGYPIEFAGAPQTRADALLRVFGPPILPPLHPFQHAIKEKTVRMFASADSTRGMLSLPTGAGKTRIAVESLVEWYGKSRFAGPVLWIAQSEELCEQAVQAFSYIWRALGAPEELFISRLWSSNEVEPVEGSPNFVVATIQKLQNCVDDPQYEWLTNAACVVVDEAHRGIAPSYTKVLNWLGLGRSHARDRCPLLGMTATPYRGANAEETQRLVGRFGQRLDHGVLSEDAYAELQRIGVLARVRHELLEGTAVELSAQEIAEIEATRRLPEAVAERIGADVSRNRTLLESIRRLPSDWPVLLFATSVSHAQTMAALLQLEGVSAVAVHGGTDVHVRRHCIREFREGRLRVLSNYGVFTEGFDAPGIKALFVARPTFSPGLYQQMIGRGLRGPENGGKEECLIVNVADNFSHFGDSLAFREFEHLWVSN